MSISHTVHTDDHCSTPPDLYVHDCLIVTTCGAVMQTLLGEGAKVVLEGQRVLPARAQEQGFAFKFDDVDLAVQDIVST